MWQSTCWRRATLACLMMAVLAGCATAPPPVVNVEGGEGGAQNSAAVGSSPVPAGRPSSSAAAPASLATTPTSVMGAVLHDQAREWRGVPYQWGGLSEEGVDCSGLVYLTFASRLGVDVPRTTAALAHQGRRIPKSQLRPGDLVFFKTGRHQRHVGIYMGHGRFLHASTSDGVRISSLDNVYWRTRFWEARRIPLPSPSETLSSSASSAQ